MLRAIKVQSAQWLTGEQLEQLVDDLDCLARGGVQPVAAPAPRRPDVAGTSSEPPGWIEEDPAHPGRLRVTGFDDVVEDPTVPGGRRLREGAPDTKQLWREARALAQAKGLFR